MGTNQHFMISSTLLLFCSTFFLANHDLLIIFSTNRIFITFVYVFFPPDLSFHPPGVLHSPTTGTIFSIVQCLPSSLKLSLSLSPLSIISSSFMFLPLMPFTVSLILRPLAVSLDDLSSSYYRPTSHPTTTTFPSNHPCDISDSFLFLIKFV